MKANGTKLKTRMANAAKSRSKRVHVISMLNGWVVKKEGNKRASTGTISTKIEAVYKAQTMVKTGKASSVIVHDKDGKISQ